MGVPRGAGQDRMSDNSEAGLPVRGTARLGAIDVARGVAVLAMVGYHLAWDLGELRLIETDIARHPGWMVAARVIAASFLTLVGVGLVLAHGDAVRPSPFLRRLALLAGAALTVTAVTFVVFPDSFIFFGILHNIALSSLLALPLVRAPALVTAGLALLVWAAPSLVEAPLLEEPILAFLGLGQRIPNTNDYVPLFPWSGFVLAGIALARLALPRRAAERPPQGRAGRAIAWLGRHSLPVYLLHQPVLFGLLWAVLQLTGPNPVAEAAPFMRACLAGCARQAGTPEACRTGCGCAVERLKGEGLWTAVIGGRPSPAIAARASAATRSCFVP